MSFWDVSQQFQISNLHARQMAGDANIEMRADQARRRDEELEERVDRLVLLTEAMWELLSQRFGLTIADLQAHVREIDGRDGRYDGRRGPTAPVERHRCVSCDAAVPAGAANCQFCGAGAPLSGDPFAV